MHVVKFSAGLEDAFDRVHVRLCFHSLCTFSSTSCTRNSFRGLAQIDTLKDNLRKAEAEVKWLDEQLAAKIKK
jgi:hypothetical protein